MKDIQKEDELDIYDVGSRDLTEEQITKLIPILTPIFEMKETHKPVAEKKLATMLKDEDICFESALNLFGQLRGDIGLLKGIYLKPLNPDLVCGTFCELTFYDLKLETSTEIENKLLGVIKKPEYDGMIHASMGSDSMVVIDPTLKLIKYVSVNIKNDKDYSKEATVIEAYPKEVTVFESPLADEPRKFEVLWDSNVRKRPFKRGPALIEELMADLKESGYVVGHKYVNDVLPFALNSYVRQGLATVKTEIETPGFFYDAIKQETIPIKYDVDNPPKEELREALKVLEELSTWFKGHEAKVATVFKWGLIAPFIFARKQLGSWIPWLYLYGKAKSGKTTLAHMVLYMWGEPMNDNDMSGGSFDTVARVGNRLSQSTFPIVVNEPAGAFNRISVVEVFKSAIERTSSRGKYEGRSYRTIPSYAPVIFTANQYIPDDDALMRRLLLLNFTHSEKKEDAAIRDFEEEFQIKNPKLCRLNAFKAITQAASMEIIAEIDNMSMDWKELANSLLIRIYSDAGVDVPQWILKWSKSESMEDMDEEHREDIRIFLSEQINNAYGRVQVMDEDYRPKNEKFDSDPNVKGVDSFKAKVWTVVNERLIPWMIPYNVHDTDYVCLTIGFKKELHSELKICQPLKGVAELMGWEHQTVRLPNPQMVIKISFKKFMEFLYPTGKE